MKMIPLLFLLCSGLVQLTGAANRLRVFNFTDIRQSFKTARDECLQVNQSLATLIDKEDVDFLNKSLYSKRERDKTTFWIGLQKNRKTILSWSNGDEVTLNINEEIHNEQHCGALKDTLKYFNCADAMSFMCYKGTKYTLIKEEKNWCEAQRFCRRYHKDLVSWSNDMEKNKIIEKGEGKTFWTGLLHDEWEWEEEGVCSTYREWNPISGGGELAAFSRGEGMKMFGSDLEAGRLCSQGFHRIKLINRTKTWEEAVDYCKEKFAGILWIEDEPDQKVVAEWLNITGQNATEVWIGLRQSSVFGFWIWSDRMVGFNKWRGGQAPELGSQQCGVINTQDYMWSDADCLRKLNFLCEEDISSKTT